MPDRLETAKAALEASTLPVEWVAAVNSTSTTVFDAVDLNTVAEHRVDYLVELVRVVDSDDDEISAWNKRIC